MTAMAAPRTRAHIGPRARRAVLVVSIGIVAAGALAACGSSSSGTGAATSSTVETVKARPAGINPSKSAQMICAKEAQRDLAESLGATPTLVTPPTWVDHRYSCSYVYPNGTLTLSVKELDSAKQTAAYFDQQRTALGHKGGNIGIGQGAFTTTNGSLVARKDWKVLTVDVSKIPSKFGTPPITPTEVGLAIGETIMGCWSGA
jgi:hypothetical protein